MTIDQGFTDDGGSNGETTEEEPYGFMERELIFKLLASHALRDKEFYFQLRDDPRGAAEQLHIALTDEDVDYIQNQVEWDRIDAVAEDIRESLHFELVTHSW
jgi:hypothetical protein